MQFKGIFTILAACASIVAAQDGTTTSTSTMTQTVTITQCNPSVTNCPGKTTSSSSSVVTPSSSWSYPLSNSTVSAGPTSYPNTTVIVSPTKSTSTSVVIATTGSPTKTGPATLPTSGARALIAQSGLLMGVLGAGIAILA
ncbi:hypothetical protein GE09DRAFT_1083357 [Coniochaeta sp. 2T2.1]|nr:hypothetical protein GE09DRAFT_1083357 [Coniochaeta sp. 2T2.1]